MGIRGVARQGARTVGRSSGGRGAAQMGQTAKRGSGAVSGGRTVGRSSGGQPGTSLAPRNKQRVMDMYMSPRHQGISTRWAENTYGPGSRVDTLPSGMREVKPGPQYMAGRSSGGSPGTSVVPRTPPSSGRGPIPTQAEVIPRGSGRGPGPDVINGQGVPINPGGGGGGTSVVPRGNTSPAPRGGTSPVPTGRRTGTSSGGQPQLGPGPKPRDPDWTWGDRAKGEKQRKKNNRRTAMSRFGKRAAIGTGIVGGGVFMGSKRTDGPGATERSSLYGPSPVQQKGQYY